MSGKHWPSYYNGEMPKYRNLFLAILKTCWLENSDLTYLRVKHLNIRNIVFYVNNTAILSTSCLSIKRNPTVLFLQNILLCFPIHLNQLYFS